VFASVTSVSVNRVQVGFCVQTFPFGGVSDLPDGIGAYLAVIECPSSKVQTAFSVAGAGCCAAATLPVQSELASTEHTRNPRMGLSTVGSPPV
jgi:hypothetical protein